MLLEISSDFLLLQDGEALSLAHKSDLHTVWLHFSVVTCRFLQGGQTVKDEFFQRRGVKLFQVVFEVGPGWLRSRSNRIGKELVVVSTWTGLEEVRTVSVDSCNKQTNSIRPFRSMLGLDLRFYIIELLLSAILKINLLSGCVDP